MNQQTRRQFFKTLAAIAIAGTVAVVTPAVVRGKSDRSVVWGEATRHPAPGKGCYWLYVSYQGSLFNYCWVRTTKPIKKGQALVWNPDGTVRGV